MGGKPANDADNQQQTDQPSKKAKTSSFPHHAMNIDDCLDTKAHEQSVHEILELPVEKLKGFGDKVDPAYEQLGIKTIRDFGMWKCANIANAMVALSDKEIENARSETSKFNLDAVVRPEHTTKSLNELIRMGLSTFVDIDPNAEKAFKKLRINSIEKLGTNRQFLIARALCDIEEAEMVD
mmetsp:Transcript_16570/g.29001  ORF Transcript_16570/g.29001 Transcript_16570/m.29001 type:complete len:181 (+) Transcript_16570:259-801(+)|eukprot:CAMPEP_0184704418 /NCGR_PEP_ID=MMETSP0313-20130426/31155_1 /TAXON_ID=2792 /ORGANISM="Porphyridium aerugineum, Strain SAG 1380-2" /LENGTH=180 /DNA_ID=CAMNT_0027165473 /DNA_START=189 /DNA_END=731 /DNA_ORIENTATION=-